MTRKLDLQEWSGDISILRSDPRVSLDQGLRLLWHWKKCFLLVCAIVCTIGGIYLLCAERQYTARSVVMVGLRQPDLMSDKSTRPMLNEPETDGVVEMLTIPTLLAEVSDQLKLDERPDIQRLLHRWPDVPKQEIITHYLHKYLTVKPIGHSNLVSVVFVASDPEFAAKIVNAVTGISVAGDPLRHITLTDQLGFNVPKTAVISSAMVPFEPSSPNVPMVLLGTLALALCASTMTILLRDYYVSRRYQRGVN